MKKQIIISVTGLMLLSISAFALAATTTATLLLPTVFRDSTSGTLLSIQLVPNRNDTGKFSLTIPSSGSYSGTIPLLQSGQIVHPKGTAATTFYPLSGSPSSATVRMEGDANVLQNQASISILIGKSTYHLQTTVPDTAAATGAAKHILTDIVTKNWQDIYGFFSNQIQNSTTQTQFSQMMSSSNLNIISADLNGTGQIKIVGGYSYFVQPITITVQQGTAATTLHSIEFFVLENGTWRLLSTTNPTQ